MYLRHYPNRGSGFSFIILPKREVLQPAVSRAYDRLIGNYPKRQRQH